MVGWRILLWVVLVLATLIFLYLVRGILLPFIVSFIIAALLEPTVKRLRLRGYSRVTAVGMVFFLFFGIMTAIGVYTVPHVARQIGQVSQKFRDFTTNLTQGSESNNFFVRWRPTVIARNQLNKDQIDVLLEQNRGLLQRLGVPTTKRALIDEYVEPNREQIAKGIQSSFGSFFGILGNFASQLLSIILVPFIVWLLLMEMEDFKRRSPRWIPPSIRASTIAIVSDIGQVFVKYLRGVATVVLLYIFCAAVLLLFFNVPFAVLLAIVFGGLYLVPYVGNIINYVALFLILGFSGVDGNFLFNLASPWAYAGLVTAIFAIFGFIFDHAVYPQLVGGSVGLSGVVSLFVIACGAALFGLPGMIIAFPFAGSIKVILDRLIKVTSASSEVLSLPATPLRHRSSTTT